MQHRQVETRGLLRMGGKAGGREKGREGGGGEEGLDLVAIDEGVFVPVRRGGGTGGRREERREEDGSVNIYACEAKSSVNPPSLPPSLPHSLLTVGPPDGERPVPHLERWCG